MAFNAFYKSTIIKNKTKKKKKAKKRTCLEVDEEEERDVYEHVERAHGRHKVRVDARDEVRGEELWQHGRNDGVPHTQHHVDRHRRQDVVVLQQRRSLVRVVTEALIGQ